MNKYKKEFDIIKIDDFNDYVGRKVSVYRYASRGVIFDGDKVLFVRGNKGYYKFPGGGIEGNETPKEALIREIKEETGYSIDQENITPLGYYEEIRKDLKDDSIFDQTSFYFLCNIVGEKESEQLTQSEIDCGYKPVWSFLEDAMIANLTIGSNIVGSMIKRETTVINMLIEMRKKKNY